MGLRASRHRSVAGARILTHLVDASAATGLGRGHRRSRWTPGVFTKPRPRDSSLRSIRNQDVARERPCGWTFLTLAVLDLDDVFGRHLDLEDVVPPCRGTEMRPLEVGLHLVLVAGVGVHDVPVAELRCAVSRRKRLNRVLIDGVVDRVSASVSAPRPSASSEAHGQASQVVVSVARGRHLGGDRGPSSPSDALEVGSSSSAPSRPEAEDTSVGPDSADALRPSLGSLNVDSSRRPRCRTQPLGSLLP